MTPLGYAQWVDDKGLVHLGPDDQDWDAYTLCSRYRPKTMFKPVGANVIVTCLQCLARMDSL